MCEQEQSSKKMVGVVVRLEGGAESGQVCELCAMLMDALHEVSLLTPIQFSFG